MDKPMSSVGFKLMSFIFKLRDLLQPRMEVLKEAGIESGFRVLDYGCGPGSYIAPLAQLVGTLGEIHALDIHPAAIHKVRNLAAKLTISNLKTIESDCETGLPDNYVDVVTMYDTFHNLSQPDDVLRELHRVLKPAGILSFSDHHMAEKDILTGIENSGFFKLRTKGKKTYSFSKAGW